MFISEEKYDYKTICNCCGIEVKQFGLCDECKEDLESYMSKKYVLVKLLENYYSNLTSRKYNKGNLFMIDIHNDKSYTDYNICVDGFDMDNIPKDKCEIVRYVSRKEYMNDF